MVFKCQDRNHYLYHFFFPFRISSAFCPEDYRDKRCPFPSGVCKGVGEAGFKHSEQIGKMTGSYGRTYQIGWKGVPLLRFLTAKKKAGLFTKGKTKLSTEQIEKEILGPRTRSAPPLILHCRVPPPPPALLHLLKQKVCCCCCFLHNQVN